MAHTEENSKTHVRAQLRKKAIHFDRSLDKDLIKNLVHFLSSQKGYWAGYMPHQFEPNIHSIYDAKDINWVFPQLIGDQLRWLQPGENGFSKGAFGIQEPSPEGSIIIKTDELVGALIPGIGFDLRGFRMGRGKGYYDRTFAIAKDSILKVGIAWSCQIIDELPTEEHDMKVDFVISENEILDLRKNK